MDKLDGFLENSITVHKTKILPLRWIANGLFHPMSMWFFYIGLRAHDRFEYDWDSYKFRHFLMQKYGFMIYHYLDKPYQWWGTTYKLDIGALKQAWNEDPEHQELMRRLKDYNEDGIPYWDYHWHEDPITGDAWRLIEKGKNEE